jgi:hypothetical protein
LPSQATTKTIEKHPFLAIHTFLNFLLTIVKACLKLNDCLGLWPPFLAKEGKGPREVILSLFQNIVQNGHVLEGAVCVCVGVYIIYKLVREVCVYTNRYLHKALSSPSSSLLKHTHAPIQTQPKVRLHRMNRIPQQHHLPPIMQLRATIGKRRQFENGPCGEALEVLLLDDIEELREGACEEGPSVLLGLDGLDHGAVGPEEDDADVDAFLGGKGFDGDFLCCVVCVCVCV